MTIVGLAVFTARTDAADVVVQDHDGADTVKDGAEQAYDYEDTTADRVTPVGGGFEIESVTFRPPAPWKFKAFGDGTHYDTIPGIGVIPHVPVHDTDEMIRLIWTVDDIPSADGWPLKVEGNMKRPGGSGGGGTIPQAHWGAVVNASDPYIDIDVDSDNDDGYGRPDRSEIEDDLEDDEQERPKIAIANFNDDDDDDMIDFADGYDLFGDETRDDANASEQFYQVVLELSEGIDPDDTNIILTYSSSDPLGVQRVGTAPDYSYLLPAGGGHFRLWEVDAADRTTNSGKTIFEVGGRFIPSGVEFPATELGFSDANREVTIYLEAVKFAYAEADRQVKFTAKNKPESQNTFLLEDWVRVGDEVNLAITPAEDLELDTWDGESPLEIPADYIGQGTNGFVDLGAAFHGYLANDSEMLQSAPMEDRQLDWTITIQGEGSPTIQDTIQNANGQGTLQAVVRDGYSHVFIRYLQDLAGEERINAGDTITIKAEFNPTPDQIAQGLEYLSDELECVIVPGSKVLHVALDEDEPTYAQLTQKAKDAATSTQAQFEQDFADSQIALPTGSAETKTLDLYLYDRFRNPLTVGTEIGWGMYSGGGLGQAVEEDPGTFMGNQERLSDVVAADGRARILFTQGKYPTCPWDDAPQHDWLSSGVMVHAGLYAVDATKSSTSTTLAPPGDFPSIAISVEEGGGGIDNGSAEPPPGPQLDLFLNETHTIKVKVELFFGLNDFRPAKGTTINAIVTNGRLQGGGTAVTDNNGIATFVVDGVGAHVGDFSVAVSHGNKAKEVVRGEWISTAPVYIVADHYGLVRDKQANGTIAVETLLDTGVQNANGSYRKDIAYYVETPVKIYGQPNHEYFVGVRGFEALAPKIYLPFDEEDTGVTPDVIADADGDITGGTLDLTDSALQLSASDGSIDLDGADKVTIGSGSTAESLLDLAPGLIIEFWHKPDDLSGGVLLERPGQYKLEMLNDNSGKLKLTTYFQNSLSVEVTSDIGLVAGQWNRIEFQMESSIAVLMVGSGPDDMDGAFTKFDAATHTPQAATGSATLGVSADGRYDEFKVTCKILVGTSRDKILDENGNEINTVTTDAQGLGEFVFRVRHETARPDIVMYHRIEVTGSRRAETTITSLGSRLWGGIVNCADAVGQAVSDGVGWTIEQTEGLGLEYVPLVGDMRELIKEVYKGSTGCDEVSKMNVGFAVAGLVIDTVAIVAAVPTGGASVAAGTGAKIALKAGLKVVAAWAIKETLINVAASQVIIGTVKLAVDGYVRAVQLHASLIEDPPEWYTQAEIFFDNLPDWATDNVVSKGMNAAFASVADMADWTAILELFAPQRAEATLQLIGESE